MFLLFFDISLIAFAAFFSTFPTVGNVIHVAFVLFLRNRSTRELLNFRQVSAFKKRIVQFLTVLRSIC